MHSKIIGLAGLIALVKGQMPGFAMSVDPSRNSATTTALRGVTVMMCSWEGK